MRATRAKLLATSAALMTLLALAVVMAFAWGHSTGGQAEAQDAVDFSINVDGTFGASCRASDTGVWCNLFEGELFTVSVDLKDISGLPNGVYDGIGVTVLYSGVTSKGPLDMGGNWPDCVFEATLSDPGLENVGCMIGVGAPSSSYAGTVATGDFWCDASGSVGLLHSPADTMVLDDKGTTHVETGPDVIAINCSRPQSTPKHPDDGNLSGVYDILVHAGAKSMGLAHCIARLDHAGTTDSVKMGTQCYWDQNLGDPNSAVPVLPGEGPNLLPGPPPPPPYTEAAPTKFNGDYDAVGGWLQLVGCFENVGGIYGPNIIWVITLPPGGTKSGLAVDGKMSGYVEIYPNQDAAQCAAKYPDSHGFPPPDPLFINLYPIQDHQGCPGGDCQQAPWRTPEDKDFDDDGCTDYGELDKWRTEKCGDDPYNPYDGPAYAADISGNYSMTVTLVRADWDKSVFPGGQLIPGAYLHCLADLQHYLQMNELTAKAYCYVDIPGVPVNPEMGADSGDGLAGPAPPPPFGDVDDRHARLTGVLNKLDNTIDIEGCIEDRDGQNPVGNIYLRTVGVDVRTGQGLLEVWQNVNPGGTDCGAGPFTPGTGDAIVPLQMARQTFKDPAGPATERDTDGDNCPDKSELSDDELSGGLRDPFNRWDYFNPTIDGQNRVDDILKVVNQYFIDKGNPLYTKKTDRTNLTGSNAWNLGPPNGQQRVDDILHSVNSYFHDCGPGTFVDPDFPPKGH